MFVLSPSLEVLKDDLAFERYKEIVILASAYQPQIQDAAAPGARSGAKRETCQDERLVLYKETFGKNFSLTESLKLTYPDKTREEIAGILVEQARGDQKNTQSERENLDILAI